MTILTAKNFRQLLTIPGRYRDTLGEVKGLLLIVVNERNASWQLRYERHGRERWMGLGSARLISLREARIRARAMRLQILDGVDPLEAKRTAKAAAVAAALKMLTFEQAAIAYNEHHERKWKNVRHAAQFLTSLRDYVFPVFGSLPLSAIDTGLVLKVLERPVPATKSKPAGRLWDTRPETASRVRRRIENVLDWAKVRGYRSGDNPAAWAGHLQEVLPVATATAVAKNWPALPYAQTAAFIATLRTRQDNVAARALEFTVLTAARTAEVIGAPWSEIDLDAQVWTVPAERMKGGKQHRVPLSDRAVALLRALPREDGNLYVFIGSRAGVPLPIQAMSKLLDKIGRSDITVHGFRSTFMDWAHETTGYPKVVIDMALAHVVGDKVEAAYRRGELLDKRRRLMADWARYCDAPVRSEVVPMRAAQ
jgi:integrase